MINQRSYFIDNSKAILITLIVFAHVIEPLIQRLPEARLVYISLYLFHIPAFAFFSGVLTSRRSPWAELKHSAVRILQPLIILQILYVVLANSLSGGQISIGYALTTPYWLLWYLLALFFWRVAVQFVPKTPASVCLAFVAGLLAGAIGDLGYEFSLSRTLVFFPFFLLGATTAKFILDRGETGMRPRHWPVGALRRIPFVALITGSALLLVSWHLDVRWLYHSTSYTSLQVSDADGVLVRAGLYVLALASIGFMLVWIPIKPTFFSRIGMRSFYIYVLHGFLVKLLLAAGIYQLFDHSLVFLAAGAAIAVFLVATLSNEALLPVFDTALRPLSKLGVCQWWPARVTWATDKVEAEMAEVTDAPQDLDRRGGNRANRDER